MRVCVCGSGREYEACCAGAHGGLAHPATPEALMRSRYSAFCLGLVDYLIDSHHPETVGANARAEIEQTIREMQWQGLWIVDAPATTAEASVGTVEFVAFYGAQGQGQLHERSEFRRVGARWLYHSGKTLPARSLDRNGVCWCGSGRKFKKCHGA